MRKLIAEKINELKDEYLRVWCDVVALESPTCDKAGVDAVGKYFAALAKERGWAVDIFPQERAGNVITVTMNGDANAAPIALSGHMDTVHPVGSFGSETVKIEGDKIYGPGVTDCKGGIVAGFLAMDALRRCGFTSRPVVMYLQSDEEGGGKYSGDATINHICKEAADSVAFLNLECGGEGEITAVRKGIASFEFTVHGVEAHSSKCAIAGANAILEAAHKIIELEKFKDPDGLTCTCTVIKGGTVHNTVAGECSFIANVRFATMAELDYFSDFASELAKEVKVPGCSCSVVLPRVRPAMEKDEKNTALLARMNEIWTAHGLAPLSPKRRIGGSDAANASAAGIPALDGLGVFGGNIHTTDEYGIISSLAEQAERIALIVAEI